MTRSGPSPLPTVRLATRAGQSPIALEEWLRRVGEVILRLERLPVPAAPASSPEDPAA